LLVLRPVLIEPYLLIITTQVLVVFLQPVAHRPALQARRMVCVSVSDLIHTTRAKVTVQTLCPLKA
jgi:hypothetical protein